MRDNEPFKVDPKFSKENPWDNEYSGNSRISDKNIEQKVDELIFNIDNKKYPRSNNTHTTKKYFDAEYEIIHNADNKEAPLSFFGRVPELIWRSINKIIDLKALFLLIGVIALPCVPIFLYGAIWETRIKLENSRRLSMYKYDDSLTVSMEKYLENDPTNMFIYKVKDIHFKMTPIVESEILRIKQEINREIKHGKSPRLSVKWLDKFDSKNEKYADCDDFAYLFWRKAQESNILKGQIFFAGTDDLVFAHAFNLIWVGGEWRSIEPQDLENIFDLSYQGYVNITKDAFEEWLNKHRALIFDVDNFKYSKAVVPLLK